MIVKVQRPLAGAVTEEPSILVYDEFRKHSIMVHADSLPDWLTRAMLNHPKVFVDASWKRGYWKLNKLAKHQYW